MPDTKLYEILGVSPSATSTEIRKAYLKLSKQYHPDKNPGDTECEEKFKEISFANEVLTNDEKRALYDRLGLQGLKEGGGVGSDFEDIFSHLFGGGDPFGGMGGMGGGMGGFGGLFGGLFGGQGGAGRGRRGPRKGQDAVHPLRCTLNDLYNGKSTKLQIKRNVICIACGGKGGKEGAEATCTSCRGRGMKTTVKQIGPGFMQQMTSPCSDCGQTGLMIRLEDRCPSCNGKKVIVEAKKIEVHVDKGMSSGQKICLSGEADQEPGVEPGDIYLVIQEVEHETFKRKGGDLVMAKDITLGEALYGFTFPITHLDERKVVIINTPGSIVTPGSVKVVEGEGMPQYRDPFTKGNLLIQFNVTFPDHLDLNGEQQKFLSKVLPPAKEVEVPEGESVEEVTLHDLDATRGEGRSGGAQAYQSDSSDDEGPGGQRVQCASS